MVSELVAWQNWRDFFSETKARRIKYTHNYGWPNKLQLLT